MRNEATMRGATGHRLNQYLEAQALWQIERTLRWLCVFVDAMAQLASIIVTPREELRVASALGRRHVLVLSVLVLLMPFILARGSNVSLIVILVAAGVVLGHRRGRRTVFIGHLA